MIIRESELRSFGLSDELINLCIQKMDNDIFDYRCTDPTWYTDGITISGDQCFLWACHDTIVSCRKENGVIEFIEFDVECPDEITVISTSEHGLFYYLFIELIEDQDWTDEQSSLDRLKRASDQLGFKFLEDALDYQEKNGANTDFTTMLLGRINEITQQ